MKSHFIKFNFNPWKKHIDDCAIRAISGATGLDYRVVCKKLGVSWKTGYGLIRKIGIDLEDVKQVFNSYFDIIEDFGENFDFVPDEFKNSHVNDEMRHFDLANNISHDSSGSTLNDFINEFRNQGLFIVSCVGNPNAKNKVARRGGHLIYVSCKGKQQGFFDTWDSSEMLVDAYMRVVKREPIDSKLHYKFDYEKQKFIM